MDTRQDALKLKAKKEHEAGEEVSLMDCLYPINYRVIFLNDWESLFKPHFMFPASDKKSKKMQTDWLTKLNQIRNTLLHEHKIEPKNADFLSALEDWIVRENTDALTSGAHNSE